MDKQGSFHAHWLAALQTSQLVILPGLDSYLAHVPVSAEQIADQIASGTSYELLLAEYPGLTPDDIKHCFMFLYLRSKGLV